MHPRPIELTAEKKKIYLSLPYFGKHSEKLKDEIVSLIDKFFPQIDLKLVMPNKNSIGSLFRFKDRLPLKMLSSLVYKYSCAQCASGTCVGPTTRVHHMRIAEHRGRSFRTGKLVQSSKSSIREHSLKCSKFVSEDNFVVLGHEKQEVYLRMLESLFILKHRPQLNETQSAFPLKIAC